jgi:predicted phosphodiesterase
MKIALISDIHANLPALEAVLADIDNRKPAAIYCLGDLVGYNIWPAEVIGMIRGRRIPALAGNHDYDVARMPDVDKSAFNGAGSPSVNKEYSNFLISAEDKAYLFSLPEHIEVSVPAGAATLQLLFVHGSPRSINEYLLEDHEEQDFIDLLLEHDADILCFGHTHKPFHRIIKVPGQARNKRHVINLGSVGKPKDNDPRACYVQLSLTEGEEKIGVEFMRVPYDIEKAARAVEDSPLPNEFADMLRKAY